MDEGTPTAEAEARFDSILEKYDRFLRNTIARVCPKDMGIHYDDIHQEVRLRLWRALKNEREIVDPASYIYRVAATATIDAIRRVKTRREEQLSLAEEEPEAEGGVRVNPLHHVAEESHERLVEQRLLIRKVETALARLPENRRRAVGLHLQGLTTQEIGDVLGWSEPKARTLAYRGLSDLREQLKNEGIDYEID